jgi:hypothetical protein
MHEAKFDQLLLLPPHQLQKYLKYNPLDSH